MNYEKQTVGEFIKELRKFDSDMELWFSRDEEGNTYHSKGMVQMADISLIDEKPHIAVVIYPINSEDDII